MSWLVWRRWTRPGPLAEVWRGGLLLAATAIPAGLLLLLPTRTDDLRSRPRPTRDYQEALARLAALQARDGAEVAPVCRTVALLHGRPTAGVAVLLHGLTNCPRQFDELGERLYQRGLNVLIPRLPRHGLADRMTSELSRLMTGELVELGDEALDIARGLGDQVVVVGLSAGAVVAGWAAQQRSDLSRAVLIAPCFSMGLLPAWLSEPLTNLCLRLPGFYRWWDPQRKQALLGPTYAYPRYPTRGLGQVLRLGLAVRRAAARRPPAARSVVVVTLAKDLAVSNAATADLVQAWRRAGGQQVETVELPATLGLPHDLIDPRAVNARIELAYPILIDLILAGVGRPTALATGVEALR